MSMDSNRSDSIVLDVRGMWCSSCANAVERVLKRQSGVLDASVSFAAESALLQWNPRAATLVEIVSQVERLGYECGVESAGHDRRAHFARIKRDLLARLVIALFFSMWVMVAQWTLYVAPEGSMSGAVQYRLALFAGVTCVPIIAWCAIPFLRAAWRTLRAGVPGMDLLVSLGALASFGLSAWCLAHGEHAVYFDSAAMIVTFLLAGRLLETSVRSKSADAVRSLLELAPDMASVTDPDGSESAVLAKRVLRDSIIRVRPGERVPLDGVVTSGGSSLDRSLLTGETEFRTVKAGDTVEAGVLNGEGELHICVQGVWGERRVDLIAQHVREMLARKTTSQALAERVTRWLVPVICALAVFTFIWEAVMGAPIAAATERAIAVLVVTCPCALGMAVPLVLMAGVGRAAREGILFRDIEAVEKASRISLFYLDKTGTLTQGLPWLADIRLAQGITLEKLVEVAAVAERGSEHPLAKAVRALVPPARSAAVDARPGASRAVPGSGVEWRGADGVCIYVGTAAFLASCDIHVPPTAAAYTPVHVGTGGRWYGTLFFSDRPRPGARDALEGIRAAGAGVAMLTGDHLSVAQRVAHAVGIADDAIFAEQSPEAKAQRILAAQAAGACVAFVGDGLNDAPALAAADLGIAVQGATASSVAAAAIVLAGGGIEKLAAAISAARRTERAMRQNLVAAAVYNLLAIPLAITGFVSPAMAAALMIASSLSVTLNSARLATNKGFFRKCPEGAVWANAADSSTSPKSLVANVPARPGYITPEETHYE
ncbi:heavy metal translocating P-type ATPase [Burkholderia ubonensis]|uniref:heavy metal translocating P-type ATPase n=1 Tax=Burkholderia ubonensis TaxID=101571 RepID=UPI00075A74B8|nr:cation-translocating P-type ATPase [Burkholderia ubonensis]KWB75319.1 ATPase P [Burkholderia ubonensis]